MFKIFPKSLKNGMLVVHITSVQLPTVSGKGAWLRDVTARYVAFYQVQVLLLEQHGRL